MIHLPDSTRARPLLLAGAGLLSGLAFPLLGGHPIWLPGLLIGLSLCAADWLFPHLTAPLWRFMERLGTQLGHYNGILLSALLYILVVAPLGIAMRLFRTPADNRKAGDSFYQPPEARQKDRIKRMF